jgi:hypothetical protein
MYIRGKEAVSFESCQLICPCLGKGFSPPYSRASLFRQLEPGSASLHLVSLPRQQTSSRLSFYITIEDQVTLNPETNLSELQSILDAAQHGQHVEFLSVRELR